MSKFAGLFDESAKKPAKTQARTPRPSKPAPKVEQRKGREPGKRSDPAFVQITAYLRKETLPDFKAKLAKAGLDMSDFFQAKADEYLNL